MERNFPSEMLTIPPLKKKKSILFPARVFSCSKANLSHPLCLLQNKYINPSLPEMVSRPAPDHLIPSFCS